MAHTHKTIRPVVLLALPLAAIVTIVALSYSGGIKPASAAARDYTWDTAITYQNVGLSSTKVQILYYAEGESTPILIDPLNGSSLGDNAGRSAYIGGAVGAGFQGHAVLVATQPLATTGVRFRYSPPGYSLRLLYHGFADSSGADKVIIPTVLLNRYDRTTVFSIENLENVDIEVTIRFYNTLDGGDLAGTISHDIEERASLQIAMDDVGDTGLTLTVFDGSAIITASLKDQKQSADIVAAASEYYIERDIAADFEGTPASEAGHEIYMATALCEMFGLDSYTAVTNVGTSTEEVYISYLSTQGYRQAGQNMEIGPGAKGVFSTCYATDQEPSIDGFTGSAVITSTTDIVALGKVQNSIDEGQEATEHFFTIFLGEKEGESKMAIPYVRWATDSDYYDLANAGQWQRSYIAIRNLEDYQIRVRAAYYDKNGNSCAAREINIPARGKAVTNAYDAGAVGGPDSCNGFITGAFGYYTDGSFGGAVVLTRIAPANEGEFIAVNRVQHPGYGEDVNALPIP